MRIAGCGLGAVCWIGEPVLEALAVRIAICLVAFALVAYTIQTPLSTSTTCARLHQHTPTTAHTQNPTQTRVHPLHKVAPSLQTPPHAWPGRPDTNTHRRRAQTMQGPQSPHTNPLPTLATMQTALEWHLHTHAPTGWSMPDPPPLPWSDGSMSQARRYGDARRKRAQQPPPGRS